MDKSSGMRVIHTFKKLPITIPNKKKKMMITVWPAAVRPYLVLSHTYLTASTNAPP